MAYIIKPLLTEKANGLTEKLNVVCFAVRPEANKLEIKAEDEATYNVKVASVNTATFAGKNKSRYTKAGLLRGKTNVFKKAYVKLQEGETVDFFSNI